MGDWSFVQVLVFAAPFAILLLVFGFIMLTHRDTRTRIEITRQLREGSSEWLVLFGWSPKAVYYPTIAVSLLMFVLTVLGVESRALGGIWAAVFLVNFLIEEYDFGLKELLLVLLAVGALAMWLQFLNWLGPFLGSLSDLNADMNGAFYLLFALIFLTAIAVSYLRGLFHYIALTPNSINIQTGITESGTQLGREEYTSSVNASDILERLLGFGKVTFTFRDPRREPVTMLVWGIGSKSRKLESIRATIDIDRQPPTTTV